MDSYTKLSEVYDRLIKEDIDYDLFSKSIMNIVEELNVGREYYLDVGCGTGNLSFVISPNFKYTWLVDASSPMLSEAFDKFKSKKLNPKVVCQDMCSLNLNRKFDLITCTLDAVNYILEKENLQSFFCRVSDHLKEQGVFIFDINSYYKLSEVLGNNTFIYDEEDIFYTWENTFKDDILNMYLTFFVKKESLYERFDEEHCEKAYNGNEIEHMLGCAKLSIIDKFDNYSKKNISDHTERIVYVVKKI